MKLLLDTHTFIWFIMGSPNLSANARALIEDVANEKFLSVASLWEIAIKLSIGKLTLSVPFDVLIPQQLSLNGFELLNIEIDHAAIVATLPFHHRDPFDRLLIAQAMFEKMPIVSIDTVFDAYPVTRLW
ncbi:MAG: twitching motility protein PilT [Acidobacteria bacterium 13_1_20CM_3_53_8]|nr:MAG: twitching motility protein PilT [Acidobacteria bacterium 13_1_20CM_3_53_8]